MLESSESSSLSSVVDPGSVVEMIGEVELAATVAAAEPEAEAAFSVALAVAVLLLGVPLSCGDRADERIRRSSASSADVCSVAPFRSVPLLAASDALGRIGDVKEARLLEEALVAGGNV